MKLKRYKRDPLPENPFWTIPNVISMGRILLAPVALWWAWMEAEGLYRAAFAIAVASDFSDGMIARIFNRRTEWGARLDTFGDTLTYLVAFFAVCWLWPDLLIELRWLIAANLSVYTIMFAHGVLKFGRLTCYHSRGGKLSAATVAVGLLLWMFCSVNWPFEIALFIALLSALEEIVITALLPQWTADVPSSWHAWKMRKNSRHSAQ